MPNLKSILMALMLVALATSAFAQPPDIPETEQPEGTDGGTGPGPIDDMTCVMCCEDAKNSVERSLCGTMIAGCIAV